jgi:hypothetical protein
MRAADRSSQQFAPRSALLSFSNRIKVISFPNSFGVRYGRPHFLWASDCNELGLDRLFRGGSLAPLQ